MFYLDFIYPIFLIFSLSILIYVVFVHLGNSHYLKTQTQITTFFILPIITYTIVKVISGNISLSIGMVGALSIVRFRNPVRSPLELVIYFLMITLGIAISVDYLWGFVLSISTIIVYLLINTFEKIYKYLFKKSFFSFSHQSMEQYISVNFETNFEINDRLENLSSVEFNQNDNLLSYNFIFKEKKSALNFFNEMKKREGTKNIHLQV